MRERTMRGVVTDHLRQAGDLDADPDRNYAPDVVVRSRVGVFQVIDRVRASTRLLDDRLRPPVPAHPARHPGIRRPVRREPAAGPR